MRKTRSQTQAENAVLSGSATSSSRSGVVSSSTPPTSNASSHQQHQMNSSNSQKRNIQTASVPPNYVDPARLKECEDMINLLRVVELQKILSYLNISFAGRKTDYQRRIFALLRSNFDLIAPKVREVYTQAALEQQQINTYGPPDPKRMYSQMQMQPNAGGMVPNAAAQLGAAQQLLNPANQAGMQAGNVQPGNNVVPFLHAIPTQMPIHPDVRLRKLAFYDVLGTLIKPSSLVPRNAQRIQEVPFYFTLTPQQATEIASNRDIRNSSKIEHAIQVQLRFCLLETSCDQEDCFPPSVSVKVNNKLCQLPNVIPTNRPNVEPKRPPRPVNVTSNVKLSPTVTNTITVQWCPDYTRGYCIAVYLVKKLTSAQLLQRMKQKGVKPADYTRGLIKEKLTEDADCEIATTMLKVSLNCPLGKMKMSIPCRASTCSHLQCFDASLYLQMNERKPTWNCPVCDKAAVYDNLVIDGYFQEVLASNLLKPDDTEIQLHKDGSWSTHTLRNEGTIIDTPTKPVEKVEVISDDIELITTEDVKPVKSAGASLNSNEQPSSTTNSETVDLTLSDSDDDLPLAKRRPIAKQNANQAAPSSTMNGNGNQRGGMYMQQKNENKIISLDSPSPPGSPVRLDMETLNLPSQIQQELELSSDMPRESEWKQEKTEGQEFLLSSETPLQIESMAEEKQEDEFSLSLDLPSQGQEFLLSSDSPSQGQAFPSLDTPLQSKILPEKHGKELALSLDSPSREQESILSSNTPPQSATIQEQKQEKELTLSLDSPSERQEFLLSSDTPLQVESMNEQKEERELKIPLDSPSQEQELLLSRDLPSQNESMQEQKQEKEFNLSLDSPSRDQELLLSSDTPPQNESIEEQKQEKEFTSSLDSPSRWTEDHNEEHREILNSESTDSNNMHITAEGISQPVIDELMPMINVIRSRMNRPKRLKVLLLLADSSAYRVTMRTSGMITIKFVPPDNLCPHQLQLLSSSTDSQIQSGWIQEQIDEGDEDILTPPDSSPQLECIQDQNEEEISSTNNINIIAEGISQSVIDQLVPMIQTYRSQMTRRKRMERVLFNLPDSSVYRAIMKSSGKITIQFVRQEKLSSSQSTSSDSPTPSGWIGDEHDEEDEVLSQSIPPAKRRCIQVQNEESSQLGSISEKISDAPLQRGCVQDQNEEYTANDMDIIAEGISQSVIDQLVPMIKVIRSQITRRKRQKILLNLPDSSTYRVTMRPSGMITIKFVPPEDLSIRQLRLLTTSSDSQTPGGWIRDEYDEDDEVLPQSYSLQGQNEEQVSSDTPSHLGSIQEQISSNAPSQLGSIQKQVFSSDSLSQRGCIEDQNEEQELMSDVPSLPASILEQISSDAPPQRGSIRDQNEEHILSSTTANDMQIIAEGISQSVIDQLVPMIKVIRSQITRRKRQKILLNLPDSSTYRATMRPSGMITIKFVPPEDLSIRQLQLLTTSSDSQTPGGWIRDQYDEDDEVLPQFDSLQAQNEEQVPSDAPSHLGSSQEQISNPSSQLGSIQKQVLSSDSLSQRGCIEDQNEQQELMSDVPSHPASILEQISSDGCIRDQNEEHILSSTTANDMHIIAEGISQSVIDQLVPMIKVIRSQITRRKRQKILLNLPDSSTYRATMRPSGMITIKFVPPEDLSIRQLQLLKTSSDSQTPGGWIRDSLQAQNEEQVPSDAPSHLGSIKEQISNPSSQLGSIQKQVLSSDSLSQRGCIDDQNEEQELMSDVPSHPASILEQISSDAPPQRGSIRDQNEEYILSSTTANDMHIIAEGISQSVIDQLVPMIKVIRSQITRQKRQKILLNLPDSSTYRVTMLPSGMMIIKFVPPEDLSIRQLQLLTSSDSQTPGGWIRDEYDEEDEILSHSDSLSKRNYSQDPNEEQVSSDTALQLQDQNEAQELMSDVPSHLESTQKPLSSDAPPQRGCIQDQNEEHTLSSTTANDMHIIAEGISQSVIDQLVPMITVVRSQFTRRKRQKILLNLPDSSTYRVNMKPSGMMIIKFVPPEDRPLTQLQLLSTSSDSQRPSGWIGDGIDEEDEELSQSVPPSKRRCIQDQSEEPILSSEAPSQRGWIQEQVLSADLLSHPGRRLDGYEEKTLSSDSPSRQGAIQEKVSTTAPSQRPRFKERVISSNSLSQREWMRDKNEERDDMSNVETPEEKNIYIIDEGISQASIDQLIPRIKEARTRTFRSKRVNLLMTLPDDSRYRITLRQSGRTIIKQQLEKVNRPLDQQQLSDTLLQIGWLQGQNEESSDSPTEKEWMRNQKEEQRAVASDPPSQSRWMQKLNEEQESLSSDSPSQRRWLQNLNEEAPSQSSQMEKQNKEQDVEMRDIEETHDNMYIIAEGISQSAIDQLIPMIKEKRPRTFHTRRVNLLMTLPDESRYRITMRQSGRTVIKQQQDKVDRPLEEQQLSDTLLQIGWLQGQNEELLAVSSDSTSKREYRGKQNEKQRALSSDPPSQSKWMQKQSEEQRELSSDSLFQRRGMQKQNQEQKALSSDSLFQRRGTQKRNEEQKEVSPNSLFQRRCMQKQNEEQKELSLDPSRSQRGWMQKQNEEQQPLLSFKSPSQSLRMEEQNKEHEKRRDLEEIHDNNMDIIAEGISKSVIDKLMPMITEARTKTSRAKRVNLLLTLPDTGNKYRVSMRASGKTTIKLIESSQQQQLSPDPPSTSASISYHPTQFSWWQERTDEEVLPSSSNATSESGWQKEQSTFTSTFDILSPQRRRSPSKLVKPFNFPSQQQQKLSSDPTSSPSSISYHPTQFSWWQEQKDKEELPSSSNATSQSGWLQNQHVFTSTSNMSSSQSDGFQKERGEISNNETLNNMHIMAEGVSQSVIDQLMPMIRDAQTRTSQTKRVNLLLTLPDSSRYRVVTRPSGKLTIKPVYPKNMEL